MTSTTRQWVRGAAIALNAWALVGILLGLRFTAKVVSAGYLTAESALPVLIHATWEMLAPAISIVAIIWAAKTTVRDRPMPKSD